MDFQKYKDFMKKNKITYQMLSDRSGIPVGTLKHIFAGYVPNPRIDTVQAIEKALEINSVWTDDDYQDGVSLTKKVGITPIEEDLLDAVRPFLQKYGEKGKDYIIAMVEAFSEINK